ncbi:hypothetical protein LUZ60_014752 [Juncus effusus]|nr:hypothetical protein LUZ60_014752 [Juncus effusus]
MQNLVAWSGDEKCELKNLEELVVKDCINLQELNHKLPSLTHLKILNSPRLVELQTFPSLKSLEVIASGEWIWAFWSNLPLLVSLTLTELPSEPSENLPSDLQMMNSLQSLEIINCNNLAKIPDDWIPIQLSNLLIKQCPILQELPKGIERLDKLEQLRIVDCRNFKHLPELKSLNSLICLEIFGCHSFMFLPSEGLPQSLRFLSIMDCPLFTRQFDDVHSCDRTKISHVLSAWIDERNISTSSNKHRDYEGEFTVVGARPEREDPIGYYLNFSTILVILSYCPSLEPVL